MLRFGYCHGYLGTAGKRLLSSSSGDKTVVELFYDIISPYTYFQHELLKRQLPHWKSMQLRLTPVSIAVIMKASGNQPPATIPAKGRYLFWDLKICSEAMKIPFALREDFFTFIFEVGTLKTQRFLLALQKNSPPESDFHERAVELFFRRFFSPDGKSAEVADLEVMKQIAAEAGVPDDLIEKSAGQIADEQVKTALKENTSRVIEMGGFGLPVTMIHQTRGKKMPWVFGSDRLHVIQYLLGESHPPLILPK